MGCGFESPDCSVNTDGWLAEMAEAEGGFYADSNGSRDGQALAEPTAAAPLFATVVRSSTPSHVENGWRSKYTVHSPGQALTKPLRRIPSAVRQHWTVAVRGMSLYASFNWITIAAPYFATSSEETAHKGVYPCDYSVSNAGSVLSL